MNRITIDNHPKELFIDILNNLNKTRFEDPSMCLKIMSCIATCFKHNEEGLKLCHMHCGNALKENYINRMYPTLERCGFSTLKRFVIDDNPLEAELILKTYNLI
jgi:hypothetical protein